MRSRKYVLSLLGATAVVSAGAGAAAAATGSKTTTSPSRPAAPLSHAQRRYAPNSSTGSHHCPNVGSGHASGTGGPAVPSSGGSI